MVRANQAGELGEVDGGYDCFVDLEFLTARQTDCLRPPPVDGDLADRPAGENRPSLRADHVGERSGERFGSPQRKTHAGEVEEEPGEQGAEPLGVGGLHHMDEFLEDDADPLILEVLVDDGERTHRSHTLQFFRQVGADDPLGDGSGRHTRTLRQWVVGE